MTSQSLYPTRRLTLAAGGVGIAALLAACSSGENGSDGGSGGSGGEDVLARIQESGTVRIGVEGTYRPYAFHDDSGELVGFEKEIADAIAEGLGATRRSPTRSPRVWEPPPSSSRPSGTP